MTAVESPYLFLTEYSEQLNKEQPDRILKKAAKDAEIRAPLYHDGGDKQGHLIAAHALRHGRAVHALKSGIDLRTVQTHLGHSNIDSTMRYLRLMDEDVRVSYQQFDVVES